MLIRFFSKSYLTQFSALLLLLLLLRLPGFFETSGIISDQNFIYNAPLASLLNFFFGIHPLIPEIFGIIIIGISALWLNNSLGSAGLIEKNSLLGAFLLVLFFSWQPITANPFDLFISFFMVIIFSLVMKIYKQEEDFNSIFIIGLIISLASMISMISIFILPALWFAFFIYRILRWREWVILHIGVILPWFFVFVYYFISGQLQNAIPHFEHPSHQLTITWNPFKPKLYEAGFFIIFPLLSLWSMGIFVLTQQDHVINLRKNMSASWGFLIVTLFMAFFATDDLFFKTPSFAVLSILPVFISYSIQVIKRKKIVEWVLRLLILSVAIRTLFYFI